MDTEKVFQDMYAVGNHTARSYLPTGAWSLKLFRPM